jgi:hypothetical protein
MLVLRLPLRQYLPASVISAGSGALIGRQALKSSAPTTSGELKKNPKEMINNASEDRVVSKLSPREHSIRLGFCIRYGNPSQE